VAVLFDSIDRMPFLAPTLDNANPFFALMIAPGFYQHHLEVAGQYRASSSLYVYSTCKKNIKPEGSKTLCYRIFVGPSLKVVATMSAGYEHIDIAECRRRGIKLGNTPDILTDATAELGVGLLLSVSRRLIEGEFIN